MKYLLNAWYVAAHAAEVQRTPFARRLLGIDVVLFRTSESRVVALEDRCPHRFAPLSRGKVKGDELECGYHGLRFSGSGLCSHNPHGPIPPRAAVRPFPVTERYGMIWLWPGDAQQADAAAIPEFLYLSDTQRFAKLPGYLHVKANYQLIVDNLLDLSHTLFVHPHFATPGLSLEEQLARISSRTAIEANTVSAWRVRKGVPPNAPNRKIFGFGPELVDSRSHMHWYPPALLKFDLGCCVSGTSEEDGLCIPQAHFITPETLLTSHYFFVATHNWRRDDPEVSRQLLEALDLAFKDQDEPMIEAVQVRMGATDDLDSLHPLLLRTDSAPAAARRILKRMIDAENSVAAS